MASASILPFKLLPCFSFSPGFPQWWTVIGEYVLPKLLLVMIFIPAKETYNRIVSAEDFTSLFEVHFEIITF